MYSSCDSESWDSHVTQRQGIVNERKYKQNTVENAMWRDYLTKIMLEKKLLVEKQTRIVPMFLFWFQSRHITAVTTLLTIHSLLTDVWKVTVATILSPH